MSQKAEATATTDEGYFEPLIKKAGGYLEQSKWYLGAGVAFVGSVVGLKAVGVEFARLEWIIAGSLSIPVICAFFSVTLPQLRARAREKRLDKRLVVGETESTYFRIGPYETEDQARFRRADNAHEDVLKWFRDSKKGILFLTGNSGTGKSSLLNAHVLPRLEDPDKTTPSCCV